MRLKIKLKRWWRLYKKRPEVYSILFFSINTIYRLINCQWVLALHSFIFLTCIYVIFKLTIMLSIQNRMHSIVLYKLTKRAFRDGVDSIRTHLAVTSIHICRKCTEFNSTCPISAFTTCKFKFEIDKNSPNK